MAQGELTTFLCLFHNPDRAEAAMSALQQAGFQRSAVTAVGHKGDAAEMSSVQEELSALGVPGRDLEHLSSGIAAGGVVLGLDAAEDRTDEIERIFHHYSANKIDEVDPAPEAASLAAAAPLAASGGVDMQAEGVVVPMVAEQLVVGKREVDRGGVRVFRRTVEEPVSEAVSLHEEHVVMERHAVSRPVTDADLLAGGQVIELIETDEVPVVQKVARVVEEVHLGVVGSDHTETVRDTVRHTEVDVNSLDETDVTDRGTNLPVSNQND